MGVFDQGYTRLKVLIILFAFLFFIGTCEYIFFGTEESTIYGDFTDQEKMQEEYAEVIVSKAMDCSKAPWYTRAQCEVIKLALGVGGVLMGIGTAMISFFGILLGAITFTLSPNIPTWMAQIMAPIMISITMIVIYIICDILYDIIKGLPTT